MSLSVPVVFIVFNRPDLTERVFEAIARAKPKKLLIIADGPRLPEEIERCQKARAVIEKIDWECKVLKNYSELNLGCGRRVSTGLDWVFSQVDEAIILEDDCLPAPSFFHFCQTLLERYKHDERIMHISGDNFQFGQSKTDYSYYFSKYAHNWGWATWQRAWKHFDFDMLTWPEFKKKNMMGFVCEDSYEQDYWTMIYDRSFEGAINAWAHRWQYACWYQNGLSVLPNSNLVSNIGFRSDATHTTMKGSPIAELPTEDIWETRHPPFVVRLADADAYTFDYVFGGKRMRENDTLRGKIRHCLSAIKRKAKLRR